VQRAKAVRRGIDFLLTFSEWWEIWWLHWPDRGRGSLQYCMARHEDKGAYEVGNVKIITNGENGRLRERLRKIKREERVK